MLWGRRFVVFFVLGDEEVAYSPVCHNHGDHADKAEGDEEKSPYVGIARDAVVVCGADFGGVCNVDEHRDDSECKCESGESEEPADDARVCGVRVLIRIRVVRRCRLIALMWVG